MRERPISATGLLADFVDAGMLQLIDFHLARRLGQLAGEADPTVLLALALTVRELRLGSVCLDLRNAHQLTPEDDGDGEADAPVQLAWPETDAWLEAVRNSPVAAAPGLRATPFRLVGTLLYLDRYHRVESRVRAALQRRSADDRDWVLEDGAPVSRDLDAHQTAAITAALRHGTTVITGGPGTGKTTIVSAVLRRLGPGAPRVALVAPTGKAAARLLTSVGGAGGAVWGGTLHKLLGLRPRSAESIYGPENQLPFDVVVVDETSMVSLELMAQLLDALAPSTRLILLGDAHQLRSVEAGAVLADIEAADDLVAAPGGAVARLVTNYRSNADINALADAIEAGDPDRARTVIEAADCLSLIPFDGTGDISTLHPLTKDVLTCATDVTRHASAGAGVRAGEALLQHRILCGHREGPFGVTHWARSVRTWLAGQLPGYGFDSQHYVGEPLLITRNSDLFSNGDTAVVVSDGNDGLLAVVDRPEGSLALPPSLLDDAVDLHAMTVHKSQGSQFDAVSVVLPPVGSPLLTRELIYTAVTRAHHQVRLYGSWESLAEAITTPVRRASGLSHTDSPVNA